MKKTIILFSIVMLSGMILLAQSKKNIVEVLYFKANLACCKARACNALESDIQNIISKNYPDSSVVLKEIRLADTTKKALIKKYKAQSQTVIIVKYKKKKEYNTDVSDIVQDYLKNQDKAMLEQKLKAKIEEIIKK